MKSRIHLAAVAYVLLLVARPVEARAQTFAKGTVVDPNGVGVAAVDIDGFHQNGDPVDLSNDGTQGDGTFLATVNDGPGTYDFVFLPPSGSSLLPLRIENKFVIGTTDLGTITLPAGHLVEGRVVDASTAPLAGVDLVVIDVATGAEVFVARPTTDSLGEFDFAVVDGVYDVQFDPSDAFGSSIAPGQRLDVEVLGPVDLGDVVLPPGLLLQATCKDVNGQGVPGLDVDVIDSVSGEHLFTPNDNSDNSGIVDVVVPSGTFDVQFEPDISNKLVGKELTALVVSGATDLGVLTFQPGRYLSGTVTEAATGLPVPGTDVDVIDPITGTEIFVYHDNADANGDYQVVVPTGTWDVDFWPPLTLYLKSKLVAGVIVNSDTVADVALDPCPLPAHYGSGKAGSGGLIPAIESVGDPPRIGAKTFSLEISNGLGGAFGFLILGSDSASISRKNFNLWVDPAGSFFLVFLVPLSGPAGVAGAGSLTMTGAIPNDPVLDGLHLYTQALVIDSGAAGNVASTDGLDTTFCR